MSFRKGVLLLDLWTSSLVDPYGIKDSERFIRVADFDKYIEENELIEPIYKKCEGVVAFGYYTNF